MTFPRKRIRLPSANYIGLQRYFLTFCCSERRECFLWADFNNYFVEQLRQQSAAYQFVVPSYCLMPDHVHLLVEGLSVNSNLTPFVKAFKQVKFRFVGSLTGLWPPGGPPDSIWAPPKKESGAT
jgi:REP element-mobilizing transposase RayT